MNITLFSFFSGIGLLDLGFEDEGYSIALVNESHAPFLQAYKYSRTLLKKQEPFYGYYSDNVIDFLSGKLKRNLALFIARRRLIGDVIGFIGGPPCPDFSVGGKNRGQEGANGVLTQTYSDLIRIYQPDFFLLENVKGLWHTQRHREFYDKIKAAIQFSGYVTTDKLINTIEYGVPQNRERVLLIGISRSLVRGMELNIGNNEVNIPQGIFRWDKYAKYQATEAFQYSWPKTSKFEVDSNLPPPHDVPLELTIENWFQKNDVMKHPNSEHHFNPRSALQRFLTIDEGDDKKKSFKRLHRWRYSPTAAYGNNEVHLHPYKARRLSVAESLAIQSLPKEFELPPDMTLTNMFKAVGNGVPYLASRLIAKTLKDFLLNGTSTKNK